jgi:3-deoxy-D-manno-octulosonate 8-phosphate phosphatase KdsC-like HAD superfamily phosphatase
LTDGGYYWLPGAAEGGKRYYTRDVHGLLMLHEAGVEIGVVSRADCRVDRQQLDHAAPYVMGGFGIKDKLQFVHERFVKSGQFAWDEIAFIGDDEPDIPLLKAVGVAACPADADTSVIQVIESRSDAVVLDHNGGHGCVREFVGMILPILYNEKEKTAHE